MSGREGRAVPTILITGAGRGLGLELARQYAADRWRVIATVRDAAAEARVAALGAEARRLEVTEPRSVAQLAAGLKGVALDVLLCNAGIYGPQGMALGRLDYAQWEQVLRVNLLGPAALAEALVENVAASGRKVIAMMSSRLGSITEAGGASFLYASSKAALNALTRGLAVTLGKRGLIVVALSPGWVRTDMGGKDAPLELQASVSGLRKVIAGLTPADSGRFISYDGSSVPW